MSGESYPARTRRRQVRHQRGTARVVLAGHSLGATGVQEAIFCLLMLEHDFIAPSINVVSPDEAVRGLPLVTERVDAAGLRTVMTNSFGFGGTNATLVFQRMES